MDNNPSHPEWATEPIAIIGLSCKLAGDASNAENLWTMLAEGRNAWSELPESRFNSKGAYHPNNEKLSHGELSAPDIEQRAMLTDDMLG